MSPAEQELRDKVTSIFSGAYTNTNHVDGLRGTQGTPIVVSYEALHGAIDAAIREAEIKALKWAGDVTFAAALSMGETGGPWDEGYFRACADINEAISVETMRRKEAGSDRTGTPCQGDVAVLWAVHEHEPPDGRRA